MTDSEVETVSLLRTSASSPGEDASQTSRSSTISTTTASSSGSTSRGQPRVRSVRYTGTPNQSFHRTRTGTNETTRLSRAKLLFLLLVSLPCLLWIIMEETSRRKEHPGLLVGHLNNNNSRTGLKVGGDGNRKKNGGVCADITIPVKDEWGARRLELLFSREQIPDVNLQPTTTGHMLRALWAFDGRLHLGYGDETNNTGPISMHAWDPTQQVWVFLGTLYTEAIKRFRPGPGVLYTPETDAMGEERRRSSGVYHLKCGSMTWTFAGNPVNGSAHIYDIAIQGSRLLVSTGSRHNEPAFLMASDDQGETWTEMIRHESPHGMYSRLSNIGVTDNVTFVSGRVMQNGKTKSGFAYIGCMGEASFEPISNMEIATSKNSSHPFWHLVPVVLHQEMVIAAFTAPPPKGRNTESYRISGNELDVDDVWPKIDGKQCSLICWAPDSSQNKLLALMQCSDRVAGVFCTASLKGDPVWEQAVLLPPLNDGDEFASMALLLNDLYLGTLQGNLYVVREFYRPA